MRTPTVLLLALLLAPAAAGAGVELTLTTGLRGGHVGFPIEARIAPDSPTTLNCFSTPCLLAEARTEEGDGLPSLILDVPFSGRWAVEALLTRQDGTLSLSHRLPAEILLSRESYESTTALIGVVRHWGGDRVRPFAAAALGGTQFDSTALAYSRPPTFNDTATPVDEDAFSSSLAGGVKVGLANHIAVRIEGRSYWHDLPARLGGTLQQTEAGVGLTYRW